MYVFHQISEIGQISSNLTYNGVGAGNGPSLFKSLKTNKLIILADFDKSKKTNKKQVCTMLDLKNHRIDFCHTLHDDSLGTVNVVHVFQMF